jgi:hypothetical protein
MKRILATAFVSSLISIPAAAAPLYAGIQIEANSAGILLGNQLDRIYSVEGHYLRSSSSVEHSGVTVDTTATRVGVSGLARFPMKLNEGQPYLLFARVGAEYIAKEESYYIPTSVTLTQPYSGTTTSHSIKPIIGGGAELNFTKSIAGRVELDLIGQERSINLAAIYFF